MTTRTSKITVAARLALGALFMGFGLNGFLNFLPQPPPPTGAAAAFLGGLAASGYMFPLIKATEVVTGALLLANRYVPLALTILAPIVLNILAFHLFLAPAGLPVALFATAVGIYLAYTERAAFASVLKARSDEKGAVSERSRDGAHAAA